MKALRNLHWKLTLSYVVFAVSIVILLVPVTIVMGTLQIQNDMSAPDLAAKAKMEAEQYLPALSILLSSKPVDLELLQVTLDRVQSFRATTFGSSTNGHLFITDAHGLVLASSPHGDLPTGNHQGPKLDKAGNKVLQVALLGEIDPKKTIHADSDGRIIFATPIESKTGTVLGAIYADDQVDIGFMRILSALASNVLLPLGSAIVLLGALCGVIFGYFVSLGWTRRVSQTTHAAQAWSLGDFNPRAPETPVDELGELGKSLNLMAIDLSTMLDVRQRLAASEERDRISRELHDTIKQQAFAMALHVEAANRNFESNPTSAKDLLTEAEKLAKGIPRLLAEIVHQLRAVDHSLPPVKLGEFLMLCATEWGRKHNLETKFSCLQTVIVPHGHAQELRQILSEALTNVAKHAQATLVEVYIEPTSKPNDWCLTVKDNGCGLGLPKNSQPGPSGGMGMIIMRERIQTLPDGRMDVQSSPGQGTAIQIFFSQSVLNDLDMKAS